MQQNSFASVYEIESPIENDNKSIQQPSKKFLVYKKKVQGKKETYISVHFPKNIDFQVFKQLRSFKYISIFQPDAYYDENEYILIYKAYRDHQLKPQRLEFLKKIEFEVYNEPDDIKLNNRKKITHCNHIVLQLALLFAELEKRQYQWPLEYLEQLYYINGLLYVTLADYDFNSQKEKQTQFQQFINFIKKYFSDEFVKIQERNLNTLTEVVKFLCRDYIPLYDYIGDNNTAYENVLKHLLQVYQFKRINDINGNSDVKEFQIPCSLLDLHPQLTNLENKCVYKATRMIDQQKEIILKRMDREIEIMEANNSQFITLCSVYFRIFDTSYLIMKKYPYTLDIILKDWKPTEETLKRDVYTFAYKFAIALNDLHKQRFQHRDLKPNNLFLNQNQLEFSDVFIGDLDRAKRNEENWIAELQTDQNQDNNNCYNPPEEKVHEQKQYTYDIFQYGIILLEVANKGKYVGDEKFGPRLIHFSEINTFDQYYSKEAISQKLSVFNYDEEFIELIFQCLRKNPKDRIDSQDIYQKTEQLYQKKVQGLDQTVLVTVRSKNINLQQINPQDQQMIDQQNIGQDQIIQQNNQIPLQPQSQLIQNEQDQNFGEKIAKFQWLLRQHFKIENNQQ